MSNRTLKLDHVMKILPLNLSKDGSPSTGGKERETMRYAVPVVLALVALPGGSFTADAQNFDGSWLTTVSCEAARDALGYSYRFVSIVKSGVLHGLHGTEGQPSTLKLDGTIAPDGTGRLYATGHTGSKEYVPGRDTPRGTEYSYNIEAHFTGLTGAGRRIEGRPCTLTFTKE